jgi:hypothetical protein
LSQRPVSSQTRVGDPGVGARSDGPVRCGAIDDPSQHFSVTHLVTGDLSSPRATLSDVDDRPLLDRVTERASDPAARALLHGDVHDEVGRCLAAMESDVAETSARLLTDDELLERIERYEALVAELAPAAAIIAGLGTADGTDLLAEVVERLAEVTAARPDGDWSCLPRYPALAVLYAAGASAVAHDRFDTVRALVDGPVLEEHGTRQRTTAVLAPAAVIRKEIAAKLPGLERHKTPTSDRLFEAVRPWLATVVPSDRRFERAFDEWEYLLGLIHIDAESRWAPIGRWIWKGGGDRDPGRRLAQSVETLGGNAPVLAAGLFDGSTQRFADARQALAAFAARTGLRW